MPITNDITSWELSYFPREPSHHTPCLSPNVVSLPLPVTVPSFLQTHGAATFCRLQTVLRPSVLITMRPRATFFISRVTDTYLIGPVDFLARIGWHTIVVALGSNNFVHQSGLVLFQDLILASGSNRRGPDLLVVVPGCEDAIHLELAADLPDAGLVRQFDIGIALMAAGYRVRALTSTLRRPGMVPNSLKERLKKWDASCYDDDTTFNAFQEISRVLIAEYLLCIMIHTYIVQMVRSQLSSIEVSDLLKKGLWVTCM